MTRKRILFVDDEPQVLAGLQDLLRKHRREWDMVFAPGADSALDELRNAPFDVVVADMRMPGMDGAALLRRVQTAYPSVARIMLSGYADRESMVRALPVAHQFLTKPCDAGELRVVIDRTCCLQTLLPDPATRNLVGSLGRLPSAPHCYVELTHAVTAQDGGIGSVAAAIEHDPAMSAKVLQLVNSGYFGLGQQVTSVQRAVAYLGADLIHGLAFGSEVFSVAKLPAIVGFDLDDLQEHSLLTARVARRLMADPRRGEDAFAAAIVHDIGKIILAMVLPQRFGEVLGAAREERRQVVDVERERLGATHADVGAYLLGAWGLPRSIVETVAFHHTPGRATVLDRELLAAVHVADALVSASTSGSALVSDEQLLDCAFLEQAQLLDSLPRWRDLAATEAPELSRTP